MILVAGSCPVPEGCYENEREKNEEVGQKKGTCYARVGVLERRNGRRRRRRGQGSGRGAILSRDSVCQDIATLKYHREHKKGVLRVHVPTYIQAASEVIFFLVTRESRIQVNLINQIFRSYNHRNVLLLEISWSKL